MNQTCFPITCISKADIINTFKGRPNFEKIKARVESLSDSEMEYLASKMADDYCNQLFWSSLEIIFNDLYVK